MAISTTSITEVTNNGGGTWKDYGGGGGSTSNTDVFVTSTGSRARKVSNGTKGFSFDLGAGGTDISSDVVSVRWATLAGVGALNTRTLGGVALLVEDTSGNISYWDVDGNDTYGGGWKVTVVDMATTASRNSGTAATLTAVRYIGIEWDETASVGGGDPNCYIDQILRWPNTGVVITGNTTSLADDLVDTIDNPANGPYGIFERRGGVIFSKAKISLDPDASDIIDTDSTLILEDPVYDAGSTIDSTLQEIGVSSTEATDNVTWTRCTITAAPPDETVTTEANKEFDIDGATDIDGDTCIIRGFNGTNGVALNSTSQNFDGSTFAECNEVTVVGAVLLNDTFFRQSVAAADGASLVWNVNADPDGDLDNAFFSKGTNAHHAIEFGSSAPLTMTLRGMTSSGFNASDAQNDSTFLFADRGSDVTWTLNIVSGTGNFSYKKARSGDTVNIVIDPVTTLIKVTDTSGTAISGARVYARASDGTGPLPYQDSVTITRSGSTATVTHTSHGLSSNNKVYISGADQDEYNGVQTITVTDANTYTYTVSGTPTTPATGTIVSTGVIFEETTDVNGEVSDTRTFSSNQPISGWVRKSTSSPYYRQSNISSTINNSTGLTQTIQLISDE
jgi:hypothetical protein